MIYMKIKTWLKCILYATPGLVCALIQFSSVFPFCARLLPKSQWFNQQQAKLASVGRLWSHAGLVVWFRAMWTMECKKEPFILMCIPFICVIHACPICVFEARVNLRWGLQRLFLYLLYLLRQTTMETEEQGVYSVLTTWLIWTVLLSPSFPLCTEAFLLVHNQISWLTSPAVPDSLMVEL